MAPLHEEGDEGDEGGVADENDATGGADNGKGKAKAKAKPKSKCGRCGEVSERESVLVLG